MRQRLGQHYLRNKSAIGKTIAALELETGDKVVEIGPGKGALTLPLLEKIKEIKGRLTAIEKDGALIPELERAVDKLLSKKLEVRSLKFEVKENHNHLANFEVEIGDALKILPTYNLKLKTNDWKLVGNIPYYITGHLFRVIGELPHKPSITVLMIQKEVAERVTAKPPKMNLLAAATQIWADISIIMTLKPADFEPEPEVYSAVIKLKVKSFKLEVKELENYYKFIKIAFKQPRKTLLNNLATSDSPLATSEDEKKVKIASDDLAMTEKKEILSVLRQNGYDEKTRAQDLSIEELLKLSELF